MSEVRVTVEFFAQARAAAGSSREVVSLAGPATLTDLVGTLVNRRGLLAALLLEDGQRSGSVVFAVDGRQIAPDEEVSLADGAAVVIVPPISGGRP